MYPNFASQPFHNPYATGQVAASRLAQMPQMPAMSANPYAQQFNTQPQSDLQFVNGRESVDVYPMAPNSKVLLMDSTMPRFYIKQTDATNQDVPPAMRQKWDDEHKAIIAKMAEAKTYLNMYR